MALGMRSRKSISGSKPLGRGKSGKFESNGDDSHRGRSERAERTTLFTEKKFVRRGRDSDVNTFGRNPIYGRRRDVGRDDSDEETRSRGVFREMRGDSRKRDDGPGKRIPFRSEVTDQLRSRGINIGRRRRDVNGDDSEEMMSGARTMGRELRGGRERKMDGRRGERIPFRSEVIDQLRSRGRIIGRRRRDIRGVDSEEMTSGGRTMGRELRGGRGRKSGDQREEMESRGRVFGRKRRDISGVDSEEMTSGGGTMGRALRGGRGRKSVDQREEMDESGDSVEASSDKLRLKWKRMDKKLKNVDGDGSVVGRTVCCGEENNNHWGKVKKTDSVDAKEAAWENSTESEGGGDKIAEQKPVRRPTRVLDKFGKKIRVAQKRSDDSTAEKLAPVKKKKRVIKIDPYDISNKRLDDSLPTSDHADKNEEKDSEISKNAQFRAIQPSPLILSFVEENLLGRRRLTELKNAGYDIKLSAPLDNVPFSTSTERERIEENLFRNKLEFFAAAKISSSFPPPVIPEIAFAGRSNVGKSSLLNALTRQWGVVRTSDKPGLTQTINFFQLASKLCLVDLPGYGFAYAKEEVKEAWEELVKEYVSTRVGLQRVCLLIDTKWGMKPRDHELIDLMERSRTPYQIVLTKTDLVFPIDVARRAMQIQENLKKNKSIVNPVVMASSKSGAGIRNLRSVLSTITRFIKP